MIITEMNAGQKIDYEQNGTKLDFADGALTLNLSRHQRDYEITKDIMADGDGNLGIGEGRYYVAQVVIPPIEYDETEVQAQAEDGEGEKANATTITRTPKPLDMDKVELRLFSIDGLYIG